MEKKQLVKWNQLEHPNITPVYGICYNHAQTRAALVYPYYENKDLGTYIHTHPKTSKILMVKIYV